VFMTRSLFASSSASSSSSIIVTFCCRHLLVYGIYCSGVNYYGKFYMSYKITMVVYYEIEHKVQEHENIK